MSKMNFIKDKSNIGRTLIFILIGAIFTINFGAPVYLWIRFGENLEIVNFWYFDIFYGYLACAYLFIAFCIWIEKEHLEIFHIDRVSLIVFIFSSNYFFRHQYNVPNEKLFLVIISFAGILAAIVLAKNWQRIPQTNFRWVIIGLLMTSIILIPANYIDYVANYTYSDTKFDLLQWTTTSIVYNLSFVSVLEEFLFRGFLWGYLRKMEWDERIIFFIQSILFWVMHISKIPSPLVLLVLLPTITLVYSMLAKYSRQVFPSMISHTVYNMFVSVAWRILKF
jgi:membrane protease YdiL (CAAX protease family)